MKIIDKNCGKKNKIRNYFYRFISFKPVAGSKPFILRVGQVVMLAIVILMLFAYTFGLQGCKNPENISGIVDLASSQPVIIESSESTSQSTVLDTASGNLLIVGSDTTFPPFDFIDNGEIVGFDIDIIYEIAGRMGKEIQVISINWDPEFKQIQEGELDVIISAVPYNVDKDAIVDFSEPYFTMKYLLMSLIGSEITVKENLYDRNVGILEAGKGNIDDEYLLNFNVVYYKDILEMLDALKNKEIEGVLLSLPIAVNLLKENKDMYNVFEEVTTNKDFVIVVAEGSSLKGSMDAALDAIKKDGTYDTIYGKWFAYNSL